MGEFIINVLFTWSVWKVGVYILSSLLIITAIVSSSVREWLMAPIEDVIGINWLFTLILMILSWTIILAVVLVVLKFIWPMILLAVITIWIRYKKQIIQAINEVRVDRKNHNG